MRVLTVGNMYPPHHFGGYELVWRSAVEHLRSRGHTVRVLTTDTRTGTAEPDDADVHRELRWALREGDFTPLTAADRIRLVRHNHAVLERHLHAFAPDVVAWWSMGGLSLTMLEAVRRRDLPAVAFVHDEWLDYGRRADEWLRTFTGSRRGRFARLGERAFGLPARVAFGQAAEYVFVSEFTRGRARQLGLGLERTSVAHSGIDPAFLEPAPPNDWRWEVLYVGRLDERKGIDVAIRSLEHLPPEARLTIAGGWDAAEERRLLDLAEALGCEDRVVFAGQCDRTRLLTLYDAADVVAFPVRWDEPWGLVPLEAMAKGRPVVATGRGGSGEYLRHEDNCLLFDRDDPVALARAVRRLADSPDLRARLREGGTATAQRHTEPVFNAAVEQAVERAFRKEAPAREPALRVLHIGSGLRDWRHGGLVAYVEGLLAEQVRQGLDVTYLFSGRFHPLRRRPRLLVWHRGGVELCEIVNSPSYDHGYQPDEEVSIPAIDAMVRSTLARVQPQVVHIHELAGLPTSVLDVFHQARIPTVMTLQDYYALCPTFKLLDASGSVCLRREVGEDCVATVAADTREPGLLFRATLIDQLRRHPLLRVVPEPRRGRLIDRLARLGSSRVRRRKLAAPDAAVAYQRRRDVNVERLGRVDRLVAMSSRVAEIYAELGVQPERLVVRQLTLPHMEALRPRRLSKGAPIVFATLGGGESAAKGGTLLLDAAGRLEDLADEGRFELRLLGQVAPSFAARARAMTGVVVGGAYTPLDQDGLLDDVHVGIVPSVWEEAYAYAGVEFLAKGIPVIANAIGGMADYVKEGRTGWMNNSCGADELAAIMRDIVARPEQILTLNAWLVEHRSEIILDMGDHHEAVLTIYREAMDERLPAKGASRPIRQ